MEQIIRHKCRTENVGKIDRAVSVAAGTLLVYQGLRKRRLSGFIRALLGVEFMRRGVTGYSRAYHALGVNTRAHELSLVPREMSVRIDDAVTINRPRPEVFRFWRDLANLAKVVDNIVAIRTSGEGSRSHWIAQAPGGRTFEWDAEIIREVENERIAWRSLEGSQVDNAGSIVFTDAAGGRGTEVRVELLYNPPLGTVGALAARAMGQSPSKQVHEDLLRLKSALETGVFATTEGQPVGPPRTEKPGEKNKKTDVVDTASQESFPASDSPGYTTG